MYDLLETLKLFKGKLANNVDEMVNYFKTLERALEIHEKIYAYAMFKYHQDMSNVESIKLYKRVEYESGIYNIQPSVDGACEFYL